MTPKQHKALIARIVKKHGPTIDLRENPETMIEILRTFGRTFEDGDGGLPGGVGPVTCVVERDAVNQIEIADVMKAVLKLTRDVSTIKAAVSAKSK